MKTKGSIIWEQISMSTKMACGARFPVTSEKSLMFNVSIKHGQTHKISVEIENDLYFVRLWHLRGASCRIVEEKENIYAENLSETIYHMCNK